MGLRRSELRPRQVVAEMTLSRFTFLAMVGLTVSVLVSGCGTEDGSLETGSTRQSATSAVAYIGPLETEKVELSGQIRLESPAPGDKAALSSEQAFDAACGGDESEGVCPDAGKPVAVLARMDAKYPADTQADGTLKPSIANRLVYELEWTGIKCAPVGGPRPTVSESTTGPETVDCINRNYVDAITGEVLLSIEGAASAMK